MRCAQCGLPLSPARTICPRCGTSTADGAESYIATLPGVQSLHPGNGNTFSPAQVDFANPSSPAALQQAAWPALPATPWEAQGSFSPQSPSSSSQPMHDMDDYPQLPFPGTETPGTLMPFATTNAPSFAPAEPIGTTNGVGSPLAPSSNPMWGEPSGTNNVHAATNGHFAPFPSGGPSSAPSWETPISSNGPSSAPSWGTPEPAYPVTTPVHQGWLAAAPSIRHDTPLPAVAGSFTPTTPPKTDAGNTNTQATIARTMRFGYTLSGVCVALASILLIVVLFINLGLPKNVSHNQPQAITPHTTAAPSPPLSQTITPTTTTTTGYPGQQYIDTVTISNTHGNNAQTSSSFKVNQIAYINFSVHPNGRQGAVCLLWYVNDQVFSHYEFPVQPGALTAFSYTTLKKPGDGYVQLYWASTTACVDKLLAQQISFTVSS